MACLYPVLQVGVNPPGIKTSFSLPLQQDHSIALVIPRCQGSRALEVRTRSVLSSRITCSPTVCTVLLWGKKVRRALLGSWACFPSQPPGGWGNGWETHERQEGQSSHCLLHLCIMSKPPTGIQPPSLNSHPLFKDCQSLIDVSMAWTEGKNNYQVA